MSRIGSSCEREWRTIPKGIKTMGKLHFTTLNYALDYTLHPKLFECTIYTLNYDNCYTLHPNVSFTVKFDKNIKHVTCTWVLLK